jgi:hypothetical protein
MWTWKRSVAVGALVCSLDPSAAWALGKEKAMYVGGTLTLPQKMEGRIDASGADGLLFMGEKGGSIRIPWTGIKSIEYGQQVGRRWKTAILISPLALFSKGRKHYITIAFKDSDGAEQAAVFEMGKDIYRLALTSLKTKSGKAIVCQDPEAVKQMGGACALNEVEGW